MLNLNRDTREFDEKILHCFRFFDDIKATLLLYKLKSNISSGSFYLGFKSSLMSMTKHLIFEFDLRSLCELFYSTNFVYSQEDEERQLKSSDQFFRNF